jgi:hypothetical protein
VIRINLHLSREQHDTRESRRQHESQQFAMTIKELGWVLPHPSARLPRDTVIGIRGCPVHYPSVHPVGVVGYHPTQQLYKLLSLEDPINHVCISP